MVPEQRKLVDFRAANERADKIVAAQQLRQALEAADMLVEPVKDEQTDQAAATMMAQEQSQRWMHEPMIDSLFL